MKIDKYGVVMYKYTDNLGDDIQTYAAYKLLPKIDYVIDREELSKFIPKSTEKVKVIMNGWFNHDKLKFLPTPYIYPLMISMHFSKNDLILNPGYKFLDGYAKEVLKKYQPIGCRDLNTSKKLNKLGYETYFSSCMTTTINKDNIKDTKEKNYVCAVDLKPSLISHIKKCTNMSVKETTHWLIFDDVKIDYKRKQKIIREYTTKNFEQRKEYVKKHASMSFEQRMKLVEKQLSLYKNAALVVTDRIHVALPCLAMNVPVILIYYDYNKDRISTFRNFINNCTEQDFLKTNINSLINKPNKTKYQEYRQKIIKTVEKFIKEEVQYNKDELIDISNYKSVIDRIEYNKKLYIDKIDTYKRENNLLNKELKRVKQELEDDELTINKYKKIIDEYNRIKNSRTWKIIGKHYEKLLNKKVE